MFKLCVAAAVAAVAVTGPSSAWAQGSPAPSPAPSGNVGGSPNGMPTGREGFEDRFDMESIFRSPASATEHYSTSLFEARCVVGTSSSRAASLIGGEGTKDPTYRNVARVVPSRYRSCVREPGGQIVPMLLSAAIAEQLVLRDAGSFDDRAKSVNIDEAAKFHGDLGGQVSVGKIARCLVVYSPGLAYRVLHTDVGSDSELSALDALYAKTPECNVHSRPDSIPAAFQRGAIAEGLYFWTHRSG